LPCGGPGFDSRLVHPKHSFCHFFGTCPEPGNAGEILYHEDYVTCKQRMLIFFLAIVLSIGLTFTVSMKVSIKPKFFRCHLEFRKWLEDNHSTATEIYVGYYKVSSNKKCMTYTEAVNQALCFGWIDGVGRSISDDSFCNRFTPRKLKSYWSEINVGRVAKLLESGAMTPAGMTAFNNRDIVSSEFSEDFLETFKANAAAWNFFQGQANWYKRQRIHWVMSAKQLATKQTRLTKLIMTSEDETRL
jgi:uncharacterized protein YdeI (YjbR/CyaY-like superfamily)